MLRTLHIAFEHYQPIQVGSPANFDAAAERLPIAVPWMPLARNVPHVEVE